MIAIDPGLRGSGIAKFDNETSKLISATYIKNTEQKLVGPNAWLAMAEKILECGLIPPFVIETQRLRIGNEKGNPQNMMELNGVVGAICGKLDNFGQVSAYYPEEWKGTVKKEIMTKRIISGLSDEEKLILYIVKCAPSLQHNVSDAVGIGLFYLGRLNPNRFTGR